jgi:hypothetical protein
MIRNVLSAGIFNAEFPLNVGATHSPAAMAMQLKFEFECGYGGLIAVTWLFTGLGLLD